MGINMKAIVASIAVLIASSPLVLNLNARIGFSVRWNKGCGETLYCKVLDIFRDKQLLMRANFEHVVSAGGEIERERSEREACERPEGVIRLLRASSGQGRRFETWRVHPILWRASGVARGGNDHSRDRFRRPLRHGGDVLAVEWSGAADGETKGMRLLFL